MKIKPFIHLISLFLFTAACGNNKSSENGKNDFDSSLINNASLPDSFLTGKIIPGIICKTDPAQSYNLYIPSHKNDMELPVVYFFDPHGEGLLPLKKYQSLADTFDFILVGSNNSKNGNDDIITENIWNNLYNDTKMRIKIDPKRIYLCGFSGGAKVATELALHHPEIKGVIANGAGLPEITQAGNFNFSFTAIAGEGDMNMTDLVNITNELAKTKTKHCIIFFNGIHEWAPVNTMHTAFAGWQLDAMSEKLIPVNQSFIADYIKSSKESITGNLQKNNFIRAEEECSLSVTMLDGLTGEVTWFKEKDAIIKNSSEYKRQFKENQQILSKEQNIKEVYEQQFQRGDLNYWTKTIDDITTKAKSSNAEGAMYKRLKAYLSLAFYSISNQFINNNQDSEAQYFVNLYKKADPSNSEAWYFAAILDARNKDAVATRNDLLQAVANGFNDKSRLEKQPEFQQLGTQINLNEIENKM